MASVIDTLIKTIRLGEPVAHRGFTLIPVCGELENVPEFITLSEALTAGTLVVTEVNAAGSVPTLKAVNRGRTGVLLLEGEELAGGKQNRILNTSIYLAPGQAVVIPVSCTEAGRWSATTPAFYDSGFVAARSLRVAATASVTENVRAMARFASDQERVWAEVDRLQVCYGIHSPTAAAREVYLKGQVAREEQVERYPCLPGQIGLVALWRQQILGFDLIARPEAYAKVHRRLVYSYLVDTPLMTGWPKALGEEAHAPEAATILEIAQKWLDEFPRATLTRHDPPGTGVNYRLTGPSLVASILAVNDAPVQAVAFAVNRTVNGARDEVGFPRYSMRRSNLLRRRRPPAEL
ncbi:MAG: hypothetical protein N3B14_08575 [Thermoleophilia bacterium]|nr:hypothetical protein [Thermoleophilia bacterium]